MLPVVAELALVFTCDKESRRRAALAPFLAAHSPEIGERQPHSLVDNPSLAQPDFADTVRLLWIAAVAHIFDQEGAGAWHCQ